VIDFGDRARFPTASHKLTPDQERLLREFVPEILEIARDKLAARWLKRIVVEGFTDQRGSYLFNLNLSLQRSQRVLCALFAHPGPGELPLTDGELEQIRKLFLVGGYSFNSAKASYDESRRIELRLEFMGIDEPRPTAGGIPAVSFGDCALEGS
jgi:flagellar motor protein MotB